MILWNVKQEENEFNIEVGNITLLMGQHLLWYELVRKIDEFFNSRGTSVQIEEDAMPLVKKDWDCYFIPYDTKLQMDKITTRSPLNDLINECADRIVQSPAYMNFTDAWKDLQDEMFFVNEFLMRYEIRASIDEFSESTLKKFILLSGMKEFLSPVEYKSLQLQLIYEKGIDKKTLIILEMPEIFANEDELEKLNNLICRMEKKGYKFIIVTNSTIFEGNKNYLVNHAIVNNAFLEVKRRDILANAPFGVEEEQFEQAKEEVFKLVDNCPFNGLLSYKKTEHATPVQVLTAMIANELDIALTLDTKGFPPNIKKFIEQYSKAI